MLFNELENYLGKDIYPFHMPGHKRNKRFNTNLGYGYDITEIDKFDNLNNPTGILRQSEKDCAKIYNVKDSIFSVNGSTCGILSVIRALTYNNKNVLISRASHKSVYNAMELCNLNPSYILPNYSNIGFFKEINTNTLEDMLKEENYAFVMITSPTYEGYLSDLSKIRKLCHKYNTYLIVDAAHGSHIGFLENQDFISTNCDISIMSFHKNLSGLTQTAVININNENIDINEIRRNMAIFQSSSPSYILINSICNLVDEFNLYYDKFKFLDKMLDEFYKEKYNFLEIIDDYNKDRSKILISTRKSNITGFDLQKLLKNEKIEIEYSSRNFALLISTIFDSKKGFIRLKNALRKIDNSIDCGENEISFSYEIPDKIYNIDEAIKKNFVEIPIENSNNLISHEYIYSYPPGIPIIAPGERINYKIIKNLLDSKINLTNGLDIITRTIGIIDNNWYFYYN